MTDRFIGWDGVVCNDETGERIGEVDPGFGTVYDENKDEDDAADQ